MNRFLFSTALLGSFTLLSAAWAGEGAPKEARDDAASQPAEAQDEADAPRPRDEAAAAPQDDAEPAETDSATESQDDAEPRDDAESQGKAEPAAAESADEEPTAAPQDDSESAGEAPAAEPNKAAKARADKSIVLTGEDPELTAAIAAELRAAGFEVTVVSPGDKLDLRGASPPTVVEVHQEGDFVIVQLDEIVEVPPGADDGMANTDAAALRAAETIRLLVTARNKRAPRDEPADKPAKPKDEATRFPSVEIALSPEQPADAAGPDATTIPKLRIGVYAGGGVLTYAGDQDYRYYPAYWDYEHGNRTVRPTWAAGVSVGGNLTRTVNLSGRVTYTGDASDDFSSRVWSLRSTLLASWEPLGADNVWTPVLGGGVFGEIMSFHNEIYLDTAGGCFFDGDPGCYDDSFFYEEKTLFNSGVAANAGITVGRPWRFRFDVQANLALLSLGAHEPFQVMPSVVGTLGLEYDFITKPAAQPASAKPAAEVARR